MSVKNLSSSKKVAFGRLILQWWKDNKRDFPWRHSKDPYNVLIAEMLLRKTTAQQVEKIYNIFLEKYPTPQALSNANESELKNLLKPLGMEYRRAELFVKFGKIVSEKYRGSIPASPKELLQLPGVGPYTNNAVLSLSHGKDEAMVDTNTIRVVSRVFDFSSLKARARNDMKIWKLARSLVPRGKSRDFNLAVLDFASLVCRAGNPKCNICPLADACVFYKKELKSFVKKSVSDFPRFH